MALTSAILVAVGAAIVALVISTKDRQNARAIAAEDRRASLEGARLMFDLEVLIRLSQNLERAGHTDIAISKDMGAEASALVNLIGPERLPLTWEAKRGATLDEVRALVDDEAIPPYKRHAHKTLLEIRRVSDQINEMTRKA